MKSSFRLWIGFMCLTVALSAPALQAGDIKDDLAEVVRQMGYGAGIHNFKNYVLRGRPEYHTDARSNFARTLEAVARLEKNAELNAAEQQSLAAVKFVVESYNAGLDQVTELRDKGWRIEDIDRAVIIDDTPAVKGLDSLRKRWTWSELEEIEFQLGYGKAIHNFKNYVVRGREQFHTEALENFLAVESLLASQLGQPEFSMPQAAALSLASDKDWVDRADAAESDKTVEEITRMLRDDRTALEIVERTAHAYREHLDLIERLIAMQRSVRQIDLAVKINDGPAKSALFRLQGRDARIAARLSRP